MKFEKYKEYIIENKTKAIIIILIFIWFVFLGPTNTNKIIITIFKWRITPHEFDINSFPTFREWLQIGSNIIMSGLLVYIAFSTYRMNYNNKILYKVKEMSKELHILEKIYTDLPIIIENLKNNKDSQVFQRKVEDRFIKKYRIL